MEHTNTHEQLHRRYGGILLSGLFIGAVLQTAMSGISHDQARLLTDISTPYYFNARHEEVALVVLKQTLIASAAKDNAMFMLQQTQPALHAAAPESSAASSTEIVVPTTTTLPSSASELSSQTAPLPTAASSAAAIDRTSSVSNDQQNDSFPPLVRTVWPVGKIPNWGAMRTPSQWDRTYDQMQQSDFVSIPAYDMSVLTTPMTDLVNDLTPDNIAKITAKLFYSTRYFGAYDLDAGEFSGTHPAVDLKLARGTPVGALAGGLVIGVVRDDGGLGLHVLIEHHLPDGQKVISIYGHLDDTLVKQGEAVTPGQIVGHVGMTGNTTAPHLHLQVDIDDGTSPHQVYAPLTIPTPAEAARHVMNPITFIEAYANGAH